MTDSPQALLLAVWSDPSSVRTLDEKQWDRLIRTAREAKLLAQLAVRIDRAGATPSLPEAIRATFEGERRVAAFLSQMSTLVTVRLEPVLEAAGIPTVVLKGGAYLQLKLPWAEGRLVSDVDLLVPEERLAAAETAIRNAGWEMRQVDEYTERYYRQWSHELPPFLYPDLPLELDLHHQILPPTGRLHPRMTALLTDSHPIENRWVRVLSSADRCLHACVHLFQDSDLKNRLRDLTDIFAMLEEFRGPECSEALISRARVHGVERPLFYAMRYCRLLDSATSDVPLLDALRSAAPPIPVLRLMDWLVLNAILPADPDKGPSWKQQLSRLALLIRYHWLRMPPHLLAYHVGTKLWRAALDMVIRMTNPASAPTSQGG